MWSRAWIVLQTALLLVRDEIRDLPRHAPQSMASFTSFNYGAESAIAEDEISDVIGFYSRTGRQVPFLRVNWS